MYALRWIAGTPVAALVTAALFVLMAALIRQPLGDLPKPKPLPQIKITLDFVEQPPAKPKPPKRIEEMQPPLEIQHAGRSDKPTVTIAPPDHTPTTVDPGNGGGVIVTPIIRIAPPYPERCRSRGAEGAVLVQFDVAADGSVVNPRIIESADSCFNRTVLKVVSGWKYPPAMRNGAPAPRYGLVERFSFRLAEN